MFVLVLFTKLDKIITNLKFLGEHMYVHNLNKPNACDK